MYAIKIVEKFIEYLPLAFTGQFLVLIFNQKVNRIERNTD